VRRLGAIVAVEEEAAAILADRRFEWAEEARGEYGSRAYPIRLAVCGVGKAFASWSCARLMSGGPTGGGLAPGDLLVSLGTSGGLGSERVGSLRLVKEFVEHDMLVTGLGVPPGVTPFSGMAGPVITTLSPAAEELALAALGAAGLQAPWARAASGDRFIGDADAARALRESTGAALCDMESAALAKLCAFRAIAANGAAGLDYFALRSVSDNADHAAQVSWRQQVALSAVDFDAYLYALAGLLNPDLID
jgi:nucleoside phosphorylase